MDDHVIVQNLPDAETAYHTGDDKSGPGNTASIGIEICVNAGGGLRTTKTNATALVGLLMEEYDTHIDHVVQHNHRNGKDYPKTTRTTPGAWEAFLALCRGESTGVSELSVAMDKLAAAGLIDSPDYRKGGGYSAENARILTVKWTTSR